MMELYHRLKHYFGWNPGRVWSCADPDNDEQFLVYFQCDECGLISGITAVRYDLMGIRWP